MTTSVNNKLRSIQPLDSSKASKKGRLKLIRRDGIYVTVKENECPELPDCLETVFENGELKRFQTFDEIRQNARLE